jgi:hypothetical protein
MKKRLYVMSSRAIDKLTLVSTQDTPEILSLLPVDETIMKTVTGFKEQRKPKIEYLDEDVLFN